MVHTAPDISSKMINHHYKVPLNMHEYREFNRSDKWVKYIKKMIQKCLRNKRWNLVIPHVVAEWAQAQR